MAEYIHTQSGGRVSVADGKVLGVGFVLVDEADDVPDATVPAVVPEVIDDEADDVPDASWKVDEIRAFAVENGIDLGDATKKEDLIAAIEAARATPDED